MADELNGGAAAPAETITAPEIQTNTPEPITESTPRGAIDRAFAAIEGNEAEPAQKPAPKAETIEAQQPVISDDRPRNADGTFAAKEPGLEQPKPEQATVEAPKPDALASDAPSRFSADAKAAWKDAPEPVKAEVNRALRELEQGVEKYRDEATRYNQVFRPFEEMAQRSNIDAQHQLSEYVKIDMALAQDFNAGISMIFQNAGVDPRQWAAQVAGQSQDPQQGGQDRVVADLRREIAELRQGFSGIHQTVEQQRQGAVGQSIEGFKAALPEVDRPLFSELDAEIAGHLAADPSITLAQAFAAAKQETQARYERLYGKPASSAVPPVIQQPAPDLTAQTRKGQLSVTGAPGPGSNPASRQTPSSPRQALDNAFDAVGL